VNTPDTSSLLYATNAPLYGTKYALNIFSCPPSGAVESIVYSSPVKLCVTEGADSLMCLDLSKYSLPISGYQQVSFTLPGTTSSNEPLAQYYVNLGLGSQEGGIFAGLFFTYPSGTAAASSSQEFVQWAFQKDVVTGPASVLSPVLIDESGSTAGASGSDTSYYNNYSNRLVGINGTLFGFQSSDAFAIATLGGLKLWSEVDGTLLLNTYNSSILSNQITSIAYQNGVIWLGTADIGVVNIMYSNSTFQYINYSTQNSQILSDAVNDIFVNANLVAIATDMGISLYDSVANTWNNFSVTDVNEIQSFSFSNVYIDGNYLIAGAETGVYVYNMTTNSWSVYDSSTTGWTVSNNVKSLISHYQEVFVGTDNGLVSFTIGATTAQTIGLPGGFSPDYVSVSGLAYAPGASYNSLVVGIEEGALAEYNLTGNSWEWGYTASPSDLLDGGVLNIALDGYVYYSNQYGFGRFDTTSFISETLPLSTQNSDILFSYPDDGQFPVSLTQPIYVEFSKPVDPGVLQRHIVFSNDSTGLTLSYSLTSADGYYYKMTPSAEFVYSDSYTFKILKGLTSTDGRYFKQTVSSNFITTDRNPINGWNVAGMQLTLSGAVGNLVPSLVFRNPQSFDVTVNGLIAI